MSYRVRLLCGEDATELVLAELVDSLVQGVVEEAAPDGGCALSIYFADPLSARQFADRFQHLGAVTELCPGGEWSALPAWEPVAVGARLFLVPPWRKDPAPAGRIRIPMPPGSAYGTGMHAPSQLILSAMEQYLRPGDQFLDLGAGAGILSAAAVALGAGKVIACDIDADAVAAAKAYIGGRVLLYVGSAAALTTASMDLVAANIDASTIRTLTRDIARILRPGGKALLGGFSMEEVSGVADVLSPAGLHSTTSLAQEEWAAIVAVKRSFPPV